MASQQQQQQYQTIPPSHPQHPQHAQWRMNQQQMYQQSHADAAANGAAVRLSAPASNPLPSPVQHQHVQHQQHHPQQQQGQPPQQQQQQQQTQQPQPVNGVRRPVNAPPVASGSSNAYAAALALSGQSPISATASVVGPALGRIMCLTDQLTLAAQSEDIAHMRNVINDFFTPTGLLKLSLFDRNTRATKEFEVPCSAIPRFTILQGCSGVTGASLSPSFVREYFLTTPDPTTNKPVHIGYVLDADAVWVSRFDNGSRVDLRGFLRAHCVVTETRGLKIESIEFQSKHWDEVFVRDMVRYEKVDRSNSGEGSTSDRPGLKRKRSQTGDLKQLDSEPQGERLVLPPPKVGSFGITEMGMRCLEIAESVSNLQDLIRYSLNTSKGPAESLARFAEASRQRTMSAQGGHVGSGPGRAPSHDPRYSQPMQPQQGMNGHQYMSQQGPPAQQSQQQPQQVNGSMPPSQQPGQLVSSPMANANGAPQNWAAANEEQKPSARQAATAARGRGGSRGRPRGRRGA